MKTKKPIKWCEICLDEEDKKIRASYECSQCGMLVCKKCEGENSGDCPNCPPPYFIKLTK